MHRWNATGPAWILISLLAPFMFACSNSSDLHISAEALSREFWEEPLAVYKKYEGRS